MNEVPRAPSWAIERGMAAVAERAAAPAAVPERAAAVLDALRAVVPFDCGALSFWDEVAGVYRPLANADYPAHLHAAIHAPEYRAEHVRLGMAGHGRPLRFRDLPCGGATARTAVELAWPAGFREGLGMALFAPDRRPVGFLSLSLVSSRRPTDRQCAAVAALGGALGHVADASRALSATLGVDEAVALPHAGPPMPLPGAAAPRLLGDATEALEAARHLPPSPAPRSFLWRADAASPWERVVVRPCPEGALPGYRAVVWLEPAPAAAALTARELEVLTLVAGGHTNRAIARRLVVSPRTVSTHVERLLAKLDVATRAEAAVRAVRERLLVWVGDEPPRAEPDGRRVPGEYVI